MGPMVVEYDKDVGAVYVRITDHEVARTVEVSALVSVDVDSEDTVVGLECLCLPTAVTTEERLILEARYPAAIVALTEAERRTRPSA